jgi:hypothetical protein
LQVNGVDVSGSQEKALEELSRAQEPIIVEIKRKQVDTSDIAGNSGENKNCNNNEDDEDDDDAYYDDDQIIIPDLEYQVLKRSQI